MYMDKGLDTGDIIMQKEVEISPDETGGSLYDKLAQVGSGLLIKGVTGGNQRQSHANTADW